MTREEVYDKCIERIGIRGDMWAERVLLPRKLIDAIIDCAVKEAIQVMMEGRDENSN